MTGLSISAVILLLVSVVGLVYNIDFLIEVRSVVGKLRFIVFLLVLSLVKGQLVPFMLTIPLKSRINAFCQVFSIVPKLLLMSFLSFGIIRVTLEISPDTSILAI